MLKACTHVPSYVVLTPGRRGKSKNQGWVKMTGYAKKGMKGGKRDGGVSSFFVVVREERERAVHFDDDAPKQKDKKSANWNTFWSAPYSSHPPLLTRGFERVRATGVFPG